MKLPKDFHSKAEKMVRSPSSTVSQPDHRPGAGQRKGTSYHRPVFGFVARSSCLPCALLMNM
jgi:hypothetical protein